MQISNKTVWITGASSGIGEALAEAFVSQGATVILSARNLSRLNDLKSRLNRQAPEHCFVVPCDVTKSDEVYQAAATIQTLVPRLDILVNNAGVSQRSSVLETGMQVYRDVYVEKDEVYHSTDLDALRDAEEEAMAMSDLDQEQ